MFNFSDDLISFDLHIILVVFSTSPSWQKQLSNENASSIRGRAATTRPNFPGEFCTGRPELHRVDHDRPIRFLDDFVRILSEFLTLHPAALGAFYFR
jgi:hypothetical protein